MKIAADTHVHIYPCYDQGAALRELARNMERYVHARVCAAFLTERSDCDYFARFASGGAENTESGLAVLQSGDNDSLILAEHGEPRVYLFRGAQYATSERLEMLALFAAPGIGDPVSAEETVARITDAGGMPVVPWAAGKWMFGRAAVVERLIDKFADGGLLVGDSGLRPALLPEPRLMRAARDKGVPVIAGSDPLPLPGEERRMGTYVSVFDGQFDSIRPTESMRAILRVRPLVAERAGSRCGIAGVLARLARLNLAG